VLLRTENWELRTENSKNMAKPAAAGGAAAPAKKGKKKTFKKKERKHVPHGLVHVQASFNNTIVTITDKSGNEL